MPAKAKRKQRKNSSKTFKVNRSGEKAAYIYLEEKDSWRTMRIKVFEQSSGKPGEAHKNCLQMADEMERVLDREMEAR